MINRFIILTAGLFIGFCLTQAYIQSNLAFTQIEKQEKPIEYAKPKFTMHYNKVERENGEISTHDGFISLTDSTIIVCPDMGILHGKWIEEDIFITNTKTIFLNEESVVIHSKVLNASGRQDLVDIYTRSK